MESIILTSLKKTNIIIILVVFMLSLLFMVNNKKSLLHELFNTHLGRLFIIILLITVTSYSTKLGIFFVLIVGILNNGFIHNFEGMDILFLNTSQPNTHPNASPNIPQNPPSNINSPPQLNIASAPTINYPPSDITNPKQPPSVSDISAKERVLVLGSQSNTIPPPLKQTTQNVFPSNSNDVNFVSAPSTY